MSQFLSAQAVLVQAHAAVARMGPPEGISADLFLSFVRVMFQHPGQRFSTLRVVETTVDALRGLLTAIARRPAGEIFVRAYNTADATILETCMEDQVFLFETIRILLRQRGIEGAAALHPTPRVARDEAGALQGLRGESGVAESIMHWRLPLQADDSLSELVALVRQRLTRSRAMVQAYPDFLARVETAATSLDDDGAGLGELARWLTRDNFVFMAYFEVAIERDESLSLRILEDTRLGIASLPEAPAGLSQRLDRRLREWALGDSGIFVDKSSVSADHYRVGRMDVVGLRVRDGGAERLVVFIGRFTLNASLADLSGVRSMDRRLALVMDRLEASASTQWGKALVEAFHSLHLGFVLEAREGDLVAAAQMLAQAEQDGAPRALVIAHEGEEVGYSLISVPRGRFREDLRHSMNAVLRDALQLDSASHRLVMLDRENVVVRFSLIRQEGFPTADLKGLASQLVQLLATWEERVLEALIGSHGAEEGARLHAAWCGSFDESYSHAIEPGAAAADIVCLERMANSGEFQLQLTPGADGLWTLRTYSPTRIYPSDSMPLLANFGLTVRNENAYRMNSEPMAHLSVFSVELLPHCKVDAGLFTEALRAVLSGRCKDDPLNRLVLQEGLSWLLVDLFRAFLRYDQLIGAPFTQEVVQRTWLTHHGAARLLLELFEARFDPDRTADATARGALSNETEAAFLAYLEDVKGATEDRVLRNAWTLVKALLRSNFYSCGDDPAHPIALKFDCSSVTHMPNPRPRFEIYCHHSGVEGVHLRGGMVARGGLRWSDRYGDYRTEVLGLMTTQMVKNVLIVPVGAKGGFVIKEPLGPENPRDANEYYRIFVRGLLDVTDNVVAGEVVHPPRTVRYDGDDTYLVVAADKGTAHQSDNANGLSREYGFWLDDAFASGGSAGYDHKKYAITAKGAWECVRQHFAELNIDPEKDEISVVGIGDMSGDVFGNGLLLSTTMKLKGAFNHKHIFLDPNPHPVRSWMERQRLFNLPRSQWSDYDEFVLSEGGGVFPRDAKRIELTPQIREMLGTDVEVMSGDELISALLTLEVDLLWNGGIGTYVKASSESHADAADQANDRVRVDANQLRCRVVGEGGNLGFTQWARVEYASRGGMIHTDAIDNSGGVDMSDHEVNLKILLSVLEDEGTLSRQARNDLLHRIGNTVTRFVLDNNRSHAIALGVDHQRSKSALRPFQQLQHEMRLEGRIDTAREGLPTGTEYLRRLDAGEGLHKCELARLLPYEKMRIFEDLLDDARFAGPFVRRAVERYFPDEVTTRFPQAVERHQLHKAIAATVITGHIVDKAGTCFFYQMRQSTGRSTAEIALAYLVAEELTGGADLKKQVCRRDGLKALVMYRAVHRIEQVLATITRWILDSGLDVFDTDSLVERFSAGMRAYRRLVPEQLRLDDRREHARQVDWFTTRNVSRPLATDLAGFQFLAAGLDLCELSHAHELTVEAAFELSNALDEACLLGAVRQLAASSSSSDTWTQVALDQLDGRMRSLSQRLARCALAHRTDADGRIDQAISAFLAQREAALTHCSRVHDAIAETKGRGLAPALVLLESIHQLEG